MVWGGVVSCDLFVSETRSHDTIPLLALRVEGPVKAKEGLVSRLANPSVCIINDVQWQSQVHT